MLAQKGTNSQCELLNFVILLSKKGYNDEIALNVFSLYSLYFILPIIVFEVSADRQNALKHFTSSSENINQLF